MYSHGCLKEAPPAHNIFFFGFASTWTSEMDLPLLVSLFVLNRGGWVNATEAKIPGVFLSYLIIEAFPQSAIFAWIKSM